MIKTHFKVPIKQTYICLIFNDDKNHVVKNNTIPISFSLNLLIYYTLSLFDLCYILQLITLYGLI